MEIESAQSIQKNLQHIQEVTVDATKQSGRAPDSVTIMAVTKNRTAEEIDAAVKAGITVVGENRVQEALGKQSQVETSPQWHLIGHLQRNKVKQALKLFGTVHSVDSLRLAKELNQRADQMEIDEVSILIQINTSGEAEKFGVHPDMAAPLVDEIMVLPRLRLKGLMAIGSFAENPKDAKPEFDTLRILSERISPMVSAPHTVRELSMGMSHDYAVAIECGSTIVRVGTALFGPRTSGPPGVNR